MKRTKNDEKEVKKKNLISVVGLFSFGNGFRAESKNKQSMTTTTTSTMTVSLISCQT
jgi:hypothetical protein